MTCHLNANHLHRPHLNSKIPWPSRAKIPLPAALKVYILSSGFVEDDIGTVRENGKYGERGRVAGRKGGGHLVEKAQIEAIFCCCIPCSPASLQERVIGALFPGQMLLKWLETLSLEQL